MFRRASRGALVVGLFAVVLSACADGDAELTTTSVDEATTTTSGSIEASTTTSGSAEAAITIEGFAFSGASSVDLGTTVVATNEDGVTHTWTSVDEVWNSGSLSNGESFEFTFTEAGEFDYFCSIHPQMTGTITVEG